MHEAYEAPDDCEALCRVTFTLCRVVPDSRWSQLPLFRVVPLFNFLLLIFVVELVVQFCFDANVNLLGRGLLTLVVTLLLGSIFVGTFLASSLVYATESVNDNDALLPAFKSIPSTFWWGLQALTGPQRTGFAFGQGTNVNSRASAASLSSHSGIRYLLR